MNKYILLPPRGHRAIARQLARLSGAQTISYDTSRDLRIKSNACIINWGNSSFERRVLSDDFCVFNQFEAVAQAVDKLKAFEAMKEFEVPLPDFTTDEDTAYNWFKEGRVVYTRTLLRASSGRGIYVQNPDGDNDWNIIATAKLHTARFNGKYEFRVHVFDGNIIHIQQKKRRKNLPDTHEHFVKNHDNGYVFAIQDVACPELVKEAAINAVDSCGLDFGAVDIGYAPTRNTACVFEINTRPALSGTSLIRYTEAIKQLGEA